MGKAIIMCGRKGGVGKSTVVENFAVHAAQNLGLRVIVVDADPQKTSYKFFQARIDENESREGTDKPTLAYVHCELHAPDGNLAKIVKEHKQNYDLVIIDTQGGSSRALTSCLKVADTVVAVTGTAGKEMLELGEVIQLVRTIEQDYQDRLPDDVGEFTIDLRVLFNRCKTSSAQYAKALEVAQEIDEHAVVMSTKIKYIEKLNDIDLDLSGLALTDKEVFRKIRNSGKNSFGMALEELIS